VIFILCLLIILLILFDNSCLFFLLSSVFDDDEFIHRIRLKLNVIFIDELVSLHLWHYWNNDKATATNKINMDTKFWELWNKNNFLFNNITKIENKYTINN
jgi:hypothetical protein